MKVLKACPCVIVDDHILAFEHPVAGYQIPKGTVEDDESIEAAVLRELEEESGISTGSIIDKIGALDWVIDAGTTTFKKSQRQEWHIYLVDPGEPLPARWEHVAEGSEAENGLIFRYFWQPLEDIPDAFHPVYHRVIQMVTTHLSRR